MPYIRAKAQDYYEHLGGGIDSDILNDTSASARLPVDEARVCYQCDFDCPRMALMLKSQTMPHRLKKTFKSLYPLANTGFELWLVAWNIAYLFDKTSFYRPWLSWIGVDLRRLGAADLVSCYKLRKTANLIFLRNRELGSLKRSNREIETRELSRHYGCG